MAGSRPICSHARRTPSNVSATTSSERKPMLNSVANRAASAGVRFGPAPPMITGTRLCTGLGSAGASTSV